MHIPTELLKNGWLPFTASPEIYYKIVTDDEAYIAALDLSGEWRPPTVGNLLVYAYGRIEEFGPKQEKLK